MPANKPRPFIIGADISWVPQQEAEGRRFSVGGAEKDIFAILKDHGFNAVRLRVFHRPAAPKGYSAKGFCDTAHTVAMAKRAHAAGMSLLIDFHYSDTWADPAHQTKPSAWTDLHGADLENAVAEHTREVLSALKRQGTPPELVQIGNEISNGMLWPDGQVWKTRRWDVFAGLIRAGIRGARQAQPEVKILLHLAFGGQNAESRAFLDRLAEQKVPFDILGQSYYPRWHGTLEQLAANLTDLARRYPQDILLVEYSVPNVRRINDIVRALPGGKGLGAYIWEPTGWEGPALFDAHGAAKPELRIYRQVALDYAKRAR